LKKNKNKTPIAIRVVAWLFPKLERIAPSLANRYFIHIFFTPFHYQEPEKEKEFIKSAKKFEVQLMNKRVQCYRWGDVGPKVMLVHGWAGRTGQFRALIPALVNAGFQAIAFDGPAHGRSEGKQTNLMEFADVIRHLLGMEGTFVGVIGHSFGGIAALYAIAHGNHIPKLITISSPTLPAQVISNFRHAINASENVGTAIDAWLQKKYNKSFEEFSGIHAVKMLPAPLDFLLVQDENDPEVGPENATELKKVYPPLKVHITKGLGHTRILRDETVIFRCIQFLKA
jgi:pimeloyl-ACP methyl ester carboxylesterase